MCVWNAIPIGGRQRGGGFAAQKGSQPRLAALGSPFQGKGLAWTPPLLPLEGGAPKRRKLDRESGIPDTKPSPRGEGGERSEPDRVLAV